MSSLPARPPRPPAAPARALSVVLRDHGPAWLWRLLNPLSRERFAAPPPALLPRIERTVDDRRVVIRKGGGRGSAEPVVLLATVGVTTDVFRCGGGGTLVDRLVGEGFGVWLVDLDVGAASFDDLAARDLSVALDAVRELSGYPRVHIVGHGLGGQLALAWAARTGGDRLASMAVASAPVRFPTSPPGLRAAAAVARRLPGNWRVPTREVARWASPWVDEPGGERRRAALVQATDDVPLAVLAQVHAWFEAGALVDRGGALDYGAALARIREPLWLGLGDGDAWCPASWALPLREAWRGGPVTVHRYPASLDHLDVVLHPDAEEAVHAPLVAWLARHRVRAWREAEDVVVLD